VRGVPPLGARPPQPLPTMEPTDIGAAMPVGLPVVAVEGVTGSGKKRRRVANPDETPEERTARLRAAGNLRVKRFRDREKARKQQDFQIKTSVDQGLCAPLPPKRKPGKPWSVREEECLRKGVQTFGVGKWQKILTDPELGAALHQRSNVDLKDKWRLLSNKTDKGVGGGAEKSAARSMLAALAVPAGELTEDQLAERVQVCETTRQQAEAQLSRAETQVRRAQSSLATAKSREERARKDLMAAKQRAAEAGVVPVVPPPGTQ